MRKKQGFTLIEMLVVIIIIAVLAAIALPQYQRAVAMSKYNMLKQIIASALEVQELHYLETGEYVLHMWEIGFPLATDGEYKGRKRIYCYVGKNNSDKPKYIYCKDNSIHMGYEENLLHGGGTPRLRYCMLYDEVDNQNSMQAKICQRETGKSISDGNGARSYYSYPL